MYSLHSLRRACKGFWIFISRKKCILSFLNIFFHSHNPDKYSLLKSLKYTNLTSSYLQMMQKWPSSDFPSITSIFLILNWFENRFLGLRRFPMIFALSSNPVEVGAKEADKKEWFVNSSAPEQSLLAFINQQTGIDFVVEDFQLLREVCFLFPSNFPAS